MWYSLDQSYPILLVKLGKLWSTHPNSGSPGYIVLPYGSHQSTILILQKEHDALSNSDFIRAYALPVFSTHIYSKNSGQSFFYETRPPHC